jgi:hypothetical protein
MAQSLASVRTCEQAPARRSGRLRAGRALATPDVAAATRAVAVMRGGAASGSTNDSQAAMMDPDIIQFLVRRLGLSRQEAEALERGDVASVIAGRSGSEPTLLALLALASRPEARAGTSGAGAGEPVPAHLAQAERAHAPRLDGARQLDQARRAVRQLRRDLRSVDTIFRHLGHVFGACPACFGMSEECGRCHGHGIPGSLMPLRDELLIWVEPALARLGLQVIPIDVEPPATPEDDELH